MRSIPAIENAFFDWIDGLSVVSSASIMWGSQKAPKRLKPSVTLSIDSLSMIGQDYTTNNASPTTGQVTIAGNRELTLGIEVLGSGALGILETIRSSLERQSIISYFFGKNIAYVNPLSDIISLTELTDETLEERYTLDLLFRFTQDQADPGVSDPAEYIDTVNVDREINDDVDLIFDNTFTIPPT